ncbi:substrate-binding domain-containing protein [Massilia sp. TS11]|uniref:helix-turn-helix transcriptional regulator n=1 Tax=Massilia sp. TS11 TaxID=2908003 RepID=UPI001EDAFB10|nr:substrate-binding domain-containing protein [Massilia sp. TS11]MCG2584952.1 helix-turn-helix transcriptional regulator [Massilia sp. TS11]
MHKISIETVWTISDRQGGQVSPRLLNLLSDVQVAGSLSAACRATGASYRHAWNLIKEGERQLGMPLLDMERGKGSRLTTLGEKLAWAGHRIAARLGPTLESLAAELEGELQKVLAAEKRVLKFQASHGFAVEKLVESLTQAGSPVERRYTGSVEAVASHYAGACELAGFHIPQGEFERVVFQHYRQWLDPATSCLINVTNRRQGLMVAPGNPLKIYSVADLARPGLRFVNRQPGSGTRYLIECLMKKARVESRQVSGFNLSEFTHAAVAAYVASGMADVGPGVEPPARRFKLDFVPLATERYFLLCHKERLRTPQIQAVLDVLNDDSFRKAVDELPGYSAEKCGTVQTLAEAFPGLS